jgi:hypothetical protein
MKHTVKDIIPPPVSNNLLKIHANVSLGEVQKVDPCGIVQKVDPCGIVSKVDPCGVVSQVDPCGIVHKSEK